MLKILEEFDRDYKIKRKRRKKVSLKKNIESKINTNFDEISNVNINNQFQQYHPYQQYQYNEYLDTYSNINLNTERIKQDEKTDKTVRNIFIGGTIGLGCLGSLGITILVIFIVILVVLFLILAVASSTEVETTNFLFVVMPTIFNFQKNN